MKDLMAQIVSLAKHRGFVFLSSEIYGGFGSSYDFGPLGVMMKNNIKKEWWDKMTKSYDNIVGLDTAILTNPKIWQASGHLTAGFSDELVECKKCHKRFRFDEPLEEEPPGGLSNSPECGGELTEPKKFNLMMKTFDGPVENKAGTAFLRAETCQGIYVNFINVLNSSRLKIPFGIAQIGKSFRNEITPGNFIYRVREFEQMEMQWFCHPENAEKFFDFWKTERIKWYLDLGVKKENLRFKEVSKKDLAHYAKRAVDIEYKFPFGWKEVEGIHNRGDWDLSNHSKSSGEDLRYFDERAKEKYFPYIIETSAGAERSFLMFLIDAYSEIHKGRANVGNAEILLKIHKNLAPFDVAIFPLLKNKPELTEKAKEIYQQLKFCFRVQYDEVGSVGRRYRRNDEIGTPCAITVDFETLEKNDVTVRDRDTMKQERVKVEDLIVFLRKKLKLVC